MAHHAMSKVEVFLIGSKKYFRAGLVMPMVRVENRHENRAIEKHLQAVSPKLC